MKDRGFSEERESVFEKESNGFWGALHLALFVSRHPEMWIWGQKRSSLETLVKESFT